MFTGLITAASVFVAWALGREVDPEGKISALLAAALVIEGSAEEPGTWRLPFAGAVIVATIAMVFACRVPMITFPSILSMAVIGIASLLFLPVITMPTRALSDSDRTLSPVRAQIGQLVALAAALSFSLTDLYAVLPLWFAIASAGIFHLWVIVTQSCHSVL